MLKITQNYKDFSCINFANEWNSDSTIKKNAIKINRNYQSWFIIDP